MKLSNGGQNIIRARKIVKRILKNDGLMAKLADALDLNNLSPLEETLKVDTANSGKPKSKDMAIPS